MPAFGVSLQVATSAVTNASHSSTLGSAALKTALTRPMLLSTIRQIAGMSGSRVRMSQKPISQRFSLPLALLFGFLLIGSVVAAESDPWLRPDAAPAPPENQL